MGRGKRYTPEQIVQILREVEAAVADGIATGQACSDAGIVEETYYRWRNEFRDLSVDQLKRLRELEQENAKLRRLVAELSLEKLLLKDIIAGSL
jgi:putative transposase